MIQNLIVPPATAEQSLGGEVYRYTFAEFLDILERCGMEIRIKETFKPESDLL